MNQICPVMITFKHSLQCLVTAVVRTPRSLQAPCTSWPNHRVLAAFPRPEQLTAVPRATHENHVDAWQDMVMLCGACCVVRL
jgi:hypothetical protein